MALYLTILNGVKTLMTGISASTGEAGRFIETASNGLIDPSFFPGSIGQSIKNATASEAIAAGDFVNLHGANGTQVRKASAASGTNYPAHGFVLEAVANGAAAKVYRVGLNSGLTNLTASANYFLSATTAGAATATAPSASGQIIQFLGYADSTTAINYEFDEPTIVA